MLDRTGFKRKRFEDLFSEMEDKAKEVYGDKINTSERSPLGIFLRLVAWFLAMIWSLAEKVYYSSYVNTAEGESLDRLGPQVGVSRVLEQYATVPIVLTGTAGYTIPAGFLVSTSDDVQFETLTATKIGSDGTVTITAEAVEPGLIGNVPAGTIKTIVNPIPEVTAVNNPTAAAGGREKQTDNEFRALFQSSVASGGSATVDAIISTLNSVPGVRSVAVVDNLSLTTDSAGRPGRSFEAYVLGGLSQDIGDALFTVKAGGIEPYGSVTVDVRDIGGHPHQVKYSPAEVVPIHIRIGVYKTAAYPSDGDDRLKLAFAKFIGGRAADGTVYAGLTMGDNVIRMQLASEVYNIPGVKDVSISLSTDGQRYQDSNVDIAINQVAQTDVDWMEVTDYDYSR